MKPLSEVILLFLRLGLTAFGGPAAHISLMEEEVVRRRHWLTKEEFLDLLGATNLIPGPNSTEMAIHIAYKRAGWRGLIFGGAAFILPAFLIVWATAWAYVKFSTLPEFQTVFTAVKPVILAVIAQAVWNLAKTAIKDWILAVFAVMALALYLFSPNEIPILFLIAAMNFAVRRIKSAKALLVLVPPEAVFGYFAKVGSVLFGSGYVLIAFLQSDLVDKYHWITQQQLVDAIAVGQFTPGPVFTTATFIGYLVSGHQGAILATVGIFAPAFVFVGLSAPLIPKLRRSPWTAPILDGLNVASLSLMTGAAFLLAKDSVTSVYGGIAFAISLGLLVKYKINSVWLILIAAILGYAVITP